jgi:hypothetical protein
MTGYRYFIDDQIEAFERDGFVVLRGLYDAAAMAEITAWTEDVQARPETAGKWMKYFDQSLTEPSARILNRVENFCPYHDGFVALMTRGELPALVSVDAATVENGCLEVAAGHHRRGIIGESWKPMDGEDLHGVEFVSVPTEPGDTVFFDSYLPHRSEPNLTDAPRRVLYVTYDKLSEGDRRAQYYADKRQSYPPDIEREPGKEYVYRV